MKYAPRCASCLLHLVRESDICTYYWHLPNLWHIYHCSVRIASRPGHDTCTTPTGIVGVSGFMFFSLSFGRLNGLSQRANSTWSGWSGHWMRFGRRIIKLEILWMMLFPFQSLLLLLCLKLSFVLTSPLAISL